MKKCLKCGKVYDKTWGVCMKCNVTLHSLMICPHCEKEYFQGEKKCLSCDVALISADQRPLSGNFLVTTTSVVDGKKVKKYLGIVNGFCITGFGMFREIAASFTDILGGKSGSYQKEY
ncbi:MAG: YbjQ family protein, partial [Candidatus Omnitrophica bacterium]|nr:YbjQ family protein [Candidatus Omnitrophota bacterium]